jgi:hypothetical protein
MKEFVWIQDPLKLGNHAFAKVVLSRPLDLGYMADVSTL